MLRVRVEFTVLAAKQKKTVMHAVITESVLLLPPVLLLRAYKSCKWNVDGTHTALSVS